MDRETWEALPLGTNALATFHDTGATYTVVRINKNGASAGGVGLYGGELWTRILTWPATLEVIFTPTTKEN